MVDYSKWGAIEISDDEDETHPNIDTPSLYRWRHQARVQRMEELEKEKEEFEKKKSTYDKRLAEAKRTVEEARKNGSDVTDLEKAVKELEKEGEGLRKKEEDLKKKDKTTPWNVDTISKPGFNKTVLNKKPERKSDADLTDEERSQKMKVFVNENEKFLKKFGMLRRYEDSKKFLQEHHQLVCEETANYLVLWCINLEIEEKHDLMAHVAHQTICMQYILEASKQLDVDPRACVSSFFARTEVAEANYKQSFEDELNMFKERIRKRAAEKVKDALKEQEEEERQQRLGPGGLDPLEVYQELPDELKKCFDEKDIPLLQETLAKMPSNDAIHYMKRCVDSGLWVPSQSDDDQEDGEKLKSEGTEPAPTTTSTDDVD